MEQAANKKLTMSQTMDSGSSPSTRIKHLRKSSNLSKKKPTFSPYGELTGSIAGYAEKRSPARIRIAAAVRNQPMRNSHNPGATLATESGSPVGSSALTNSHSLEKLDPYLKTSTPMKPLKNYVSTVSYLRPATENKKIAPHY